MSNAKNNNCNERGNGSGDKQVWRESCPSSCGESSQSGYLRGIHSKLYCGNRVIHRYGGDNYTNSRGNGNKNRLKCCPILHDKANHGAYCILYSL